MKVSDYRQYDAVGLAEGIQKRDFSADEVRKAAITRAQEVQPALNAICHPQFDDEAPTPMHDAATLSGVPFLLKDLAQEQAGKPCTYGSHALKNQVAERDSSYVTRARKAGLVLLGRTTTPELGLKGVTESKLWGPTRNPWDTSLTPGGSSGGSAAAVAAGIVPMAGANDGGGSIRIPAAYCGLFGLKPSRGRVSAGPGMGEHWTGASADHVVSRSVRDSAEMLDYLAGPEAGDPFVIPPPAAPYASVIKQAPKPLRIGVFTASPYNGEVAPECVEAVESTAHALENMGHKIEYAKPDFDGMALARCYLGLYFGEVSATMAQAAKRFGAKDSDFELDTRLIGMLGRTLPLPDYVQMRQQWNVFSRALGLFHQSYDLYLCPSTGQLPPAIGALDTPAHLQVVSRLMLLLKAGRLVHKSGVVDQLALESLALTPFTQLANLTGTPAMSVPLHWTAKGLPVGVQFGAPHGDEATLLQLAAQLESVLPWWDRYESVAV
ncbi:amidase [Marinobacter sp. 1Y8]